MITVVVAVVAADSLDAQIQCVGCCLITSEKLLQWAEFQPKDTEKAPEGIFRSAYYCIITVYGAYVSYFSGRYNFIQQPCEVYDQNITSAPANNASQEDLHYCSTTPGQPAFMVSHPVPFDLSKRTKFVTNQVLDVPSTENIIHYTTYFVPTRRLGSGKCSSLAKYFMGINTTCRIKATTLSSIVDRQTDRRMVEFDKYHDPVTVLHSAFSESAGIQRIVHLCWHVWTPISTRCSTHEPRQCPANLNNTTYADYTRS
ncbi:lag1 longevity assurance 1 [Echinococcus multilocularis]|uniref:Lag1 longevity assurance 1 n=1 Tax=Echinococcus multilocularis TaxID=6211 RepID=A0A0S4MM68_ECHMU|nr:lag1 longevity assurance 1 [Echinococcus multilocularis]